MKSKNHLTVFTLGCCLMLLLLVATGPCFAQCDITAANLDAAMSACEGNDPGCYAEIAGKIPDCSGNILWHYMMLFSPDDPTQILQLFNTQVPFEYAELLATVAEEAAQVIQTQENAGSRTDVNEYPFGQGIPYGQ